CKVDSSSYCPPGCSSSRVAKTDRTADAIPIKEENLSMSSDFSRRALMKGICSTAALSAALPAAAVLPAAAADGTGYKGPHGPGMPQEGPNTPKICAPVSGSEITDESMRMVKQIGVNNVLMGGPKMPWQEADLQATVDKLKTGGLTVGNMMIAGFPNCIYGRPGA